MVKDSVEIFTKRITMSDVAIFGFEKYLNTQGDDYGNISSEHIKLSYYVKSKFSIRLLTFTSLNYDPSLSEEDYNSEMDKIVNELKIKERIDIIGCPPSYLIFPFQYKGATNVSFGSVVIDLTLSEDILFMNLHGKHRNVIRKAERDGVVLAVGANLKDQCYEIMNDTLARQGLSFETKENYDKVCENLGENISFFLVSKDGIPQGAAVIPFSDHAAYYLWGGSIASPHIGSINYLHWEAIKFFKDKGVNYYDFVGVRSNPDKSSKMYGIKRFKMRFGGTESKGFIWKKTLRPSKYFLYVLLYLIKNRSFPSDIISKELKNHD